MAGRRDDQPQGEPPRRQGRGRFAKSGHTSYGPGREVPPQQFQPPAHYPPAQQYPPNHVPPADYHPPHQLPPSREQPPPDSFGNPTYHHTPAAARDAQRPPSSPAVAIARGAFTQTNRAARVVTKRVIRASKADGADQSGLTALIWNQVLSYGTDAMITVALAGTVFFGASTSAQRGNVLLYLLITMAPFAVVAPVIGPVLDRFQHGRRWTMAGTAIGRAVLAVVMAGHPTELLILYPCALGSLVLSKAYGVVRAAAAPRLVPPGMTLTEANARLSIFGLGSTLVLGGFVGVLIKLTGSYTFGLLVTAVGFAACAFFAFTLPHQVDSAVPAPRHPGEPPRPRIQKQVPPLARLHGWASRGFDPHIITALQGESVLRLLSGMLTIYLAFYVESTAHGLEAAVQLGGVVVAAGAGNFLGTAVGTKVKLPRSEVVIIASTIVAAVACLLVATIFDITFAIVGMLISAITNALSKIALDALIQRDVVETLRSSAFARSETFLQLSWVVGAAIGVALPSSRANGGAIGFWVAGVIVGAVAAVTTLRHRATGATAPTTPTTPTGAAAPPDWPGRPGSVGPRNYDQP
ncbi:MAG: MFS transporter [Jatrophihabitantaceae bacterium]